MTMLIILILMFPDADTHNVLNRTLFPVEITSDGDHFVSGILQMDAMDNRLLVRDSRESYLVSVDTNGNISSVIGGKGEGPGELGRNGVLAFAAFGDETWVIGSQNYQNLLKFSKGEFQHYFQAQELFIPSLFDSGFNSFAVSDNQIVVPYDSQKGFVAIAYDKFGAPGKKFGDTLFSEPELVAANPLINATYFLFHQDHWYVVYKYHPMVQKYDRQFRLVGEFDVSTPYLNQRSQAILAFRPKKQGHIPSPLFSDVKIANNQLFLMAWGRLYRLTLEGKLLDETRFLGSPAFGEMEGRFLSLPYFSFLGDALYLGHEMSFAESNLFLAVSEERNARK